MREYAWDPMKWHLPIPPRVVDAMDRGAEVGDRLHARSTGRLRLSQAAAGSDRTAVILGNAMAGEKHYLTALRVYFPEYAHELAESASFAALPAAVRRDITRELHDRIGKHLPRNHRRQHARRTGQLHCRTHRQHLQLPRPELRVRRRLRLGDGGHRLRRSKDWSANDFDVAITGGIDRNMGAPTFVKFCKIGALSATGTRPYAEGADGFVMGEGAAIFLMKRLADAERDGDKIYAVLRGIGGIERRQRKRHHRAQSGRPEILPRARLAECRAVARHRDPHRRPRHLHARGRCGRSAEHDRCARRSHLPAHSVALGSVKSNIGHLKGAAGAAGMLKTALALHDKVLPPSVHCEHPNPGYRLCPLSSLRQYRTEAVDRAVG